jgi:hypothetical protein
MNSSGPTSAQSHSPHGLVAQLLKWPTPVGQHGVHSWRGHYAPGSRGDVTATDGSTGEVRHRGTDGEWWQGSLSCGMSMEW